MPRPVSNLRDSPRYLELLLRCLRFPELCPVTVRLPEIFAPRRQAALLIPSALLFADLLMTIIHTLCNSGGLQTLTPILNTISREKSSIIFYFLSEKVPISNPKTRFFHNFSKQKYRIFPSISAKSTIFYQLYRYTFRIYDEN